MLLELSVDTAVILGPLNFPYAYVCLSQLLRFESK